MPIWSILRLLIMPSKHFLVGRNHRPLVHTEDTHNPDGSYLENHENSLHVEELLEFELLFRPQPIGTIPRDELMNAGLFVFGKLEAIDLPRRLLSQHRSV